MEDRIRSIEDRLERLEARVEDLATRVEAIRAGGAPEQGLAPVVEGGGSPAPEPGPWSLHRLPVQVGRLFLVLAGAFLLRAITLSEAVLDWVGVGAGLAYAAVFVWFADVAGRRGQASDAAFHGLAVAAIAFPLLFEAATRFAILSPVGAAAMMLGFSALLMGVSLRGRLPVLAWVTVGAATAGGAGLTFAARDALAAPILLFPVAAMTLFASSERDFRGVRWPAALGLDGLGLLMAWLVGRRNQEWLEPTVVAAFLFGLAAFYLSAFARAAFARGRRVGVFTVAQSCLALGIGYEGGLRVIPSGREWAVVAGLAVGIVALLAAIAPLTGEARARRASAQAWSAVLGAWLTARCMVVLVPGAMVGVGWILLAVILASTGRDASRWAHRSIAGLLTIAAGVPVDLWKLIEATLGKASGTTGDFGAASVAVLVGWMALAVLWWVRPCEQRSSWTWTAPGLFVSMAASLGTAAFAVVLVVHMGGETLSGDAAVLAVIATAVLVAVSLVAGGLVRWGQRPEWRWTTVTLIVGTGCKVAAQDVPRGRAMTLFLSLALYGGALLIGARLLRRAT